LTLLAILGVDGKFLTSLMPELAITRVFSVSSQSAMLALDAQMGDMVIRADSSKTFVLSTNSPTTLADWLELKSPTGSVSSVAGRTGAVTLSTDDVSGLGAAATKDVGVSGGVSSYWTLTTAGSVGSASFTGGVLNIPAYTLSGLGGIGYGSLSGTAPISYNVGTGQIGLSSNGVSNTHLAQMPAQTFKGNNLTTTGNVGDLTVNQVKVLLDLDKVDNLSLTNLVSNSFNIKTASYTATNADLDTVTNSNPIVVMNVATANVFTIPPDSTLTQVVAGSKLVVLQIGAGQTTLVAGTGVTINFPLSLGLKIRGQNCLIVLQRFSANTWYAFGDLSA
jgi:hypothetical protein